jgi:hypothetical protein
MEQRKYLDKVIKNAKEIGVCSNSKCAKFCLEEIIIKSGKNKIKCFVQQKEKCYSCKKVFCKNCLIQGARELFCRSCDDEWASGC